VVGGAVVGGTVVGGTVVGGTVVGGSVMGTSVTRQCDHRCGDGEAVGAAAVLDHDSSIEHQPTNRNGPEGRPNGGAGTTPRETHSEQWNPVNYFDLNAD
jgi:hypothetical protein